MPRCPPLRSAIRSSHRLPHTPGGLRESNSVREELPASSVAPADGSSNVAGNHDGGDSAPPISGSGMGDLDVVCCWLQRWGWTGGFSGYGGRWCAAVLVEWWLRRSPGGVLSS
nr:hypothetical protein Iba_scaffold108536CG0010 [Ipomoea batatas]GMD64851.1 hypothetical protein Iba_scaffold49359CG0010 [Ipomoea batatas]GMD90666.1 hypothetical protein Iba_scaffold53871CG0010 [Ipomoea batatas]